MPTGTELPGAVWFDGHTYTVWIGGAIGDSNGDIVTFDTTSSYTSDHPNLLPYFDYAQSQGWLTTTPHLWQVGSGYEICYTSGTREFQQTAFNLLFNGQHIVG